MKHCSFWKRTAIMVLCAALLIGLLPPGTVRAATTGYDRGYAGGMAGSGEYKAFGLDVSSWQGSSLNFTRIKNAGYDYVILRAGTSNGKDTCFETYYTNAKAAGLDVGAYYYSYATTVAAVKEDMTDFLSYIKGKKFEYPIYLDYEDSSQQALSASLSKQICLAAMDMLAAEGYLTGMYTGKYFSTQLPMDTICAKYEVWIAHYLKAGDGSYDGTGDYYKYGPTYASQYGMYQFTDSVWINGYGPYDGDVCYKDYPSIVKTYGFNGYEPAVTESYFDKCTFYPSYCSFTTTQDTGIFSEPRVMTASNTSVQLEEAPSGTAYTATGLYLNASGNIFYRVQTSDGQEGYIHSGYTAFGQTLPADVKLTGTTWPNGHIAGKSFPITGTVTATYDRLDTVGVAVYPGFVTTGSAVIGASAPATDNKYVLTDSTVDDAVPFGSLSIGRYTMHVYATYTSYYAVSAKELGTVTGTADLAHHHFTVIAAAQDQSTCAHSSSTTVVEAATCTDGGTSVSSCPVCGLTETYTTDPLGHSYGDYVVTQEATCTDPGVREQTCANCGDAQTQQIPALGHSWLEADCTAPRTCTTCGTTDGDPLGHSYTSVTVAPGCLTDGYTDHTCTTCGHRYVSDRITAPGHSWQAATCAEPQTCTACGLTSGNPTGHSYSYKVTKPTCTSEGCTTYTCTICGHSYTGNTTPMTDHSWQAATCTEPQTCTACGLTSGAPAGHSYTSRVTKPTCTAQGYTTYSCVSCGHSIAANQTDATGHSFSSTVTKPTCTTEGYTTYTCATCGYVTTAAQTPALGHSFSGGTCTTCGAADPDAVKDPGLTLSYPTLSFEDEIIYNVYFSVGDMTSVVELGLITLASRDASATMEDALTVIPGYVTNGSVYLAKSEGIPAANMGDTLYFKIYAKLTDGSYAYSTAGGYNAKAYASSILSGNNSTEMKALVVSMLDYGAQAQLFFGHNTDKLVNAALTADQKALVQAYDSTMMDPIVKADSSKLGGFIRDNANFKQLYPSVSFDGAFAINFYCTPAITVDEGMTLYWWNAEDYASIELFTLGNATGKMTMTQSGGQYWGEVAGIAAKDMDKTWYVSCVFKHEGQYVTTGIIPYSLGKYCTDKAAATGDPQQAFAQATAVYGHYAKSYFASIA